MRDLYRIVRFRLLVRAPFTVVFPSVSYRVEIQPAIGAPQYWLVALPSIGGPAWVLFHAGNRVELLERELYENGFDVVTPTVPALILERLCCEGRAELLSDRGG